MQENQVKAVNSKPKPSWRRASDDQKKDFNLVTKEELSKISVPKEVSECCDVRCDKIDHRNAIDDYVEKVLNSLNEAAHDCLPVPVQKLSLAGTQK